MSTPFVNALKPEYNNGFWNIGPDHGFMPIAAPLEKLPEKYAAIQHITDNMSIHKPDGTSGYLATPNAIAGPVEALPNLIEEVKGETDVFVQAALFRALTFIASGYLLDPAHHSQGDDGAYGKARRFLPKNVAQPLVHVADKLGVYPWLDYHYAYSLGNYVQNEKNNNFEWTNLHMACTFAGTKDEIGFIMLHVDIVSHTKDLLKSIWDFARKPSVEALRANYETMLVVNARRREMWKASDWRRYNDFRVFIMGIKGNVGIFDDGVVYDGCFDNAPQQYRGQSGSQDDVVPTEDIFTGLINYYPDNTLTRYLLDMRTYRPKSVREFFHDLEDCHFNIETFAALGVEGLVLLLAIVDQIYVFRNGHWQFVQKYILANTRYEVATGGTPITTWLPNQIDACLNYQQIIIDRIVGLGGSTDSLYTSLADALPSKKTLLQKQAEELAKPSYDPSIVYSLNATVVVEGVPVDEFPSKAACPFGHGDVGSSSASACPFGHTA